MTDKPNGPTFPLPEPNEVLSNALREALIEARAKAGGQLAQEERDRIVAEMKEAEREGERIRVQVRTHGAGRLLDGPTFKALHSAERLEREAKRDLAARGCQCDGPTHEPGCLWAPDAPRPYRALSLERLSDLHTQAGERRDWDECDHLQAEMDHRAAERAIRRQSHGAGLPGDPPPCPPDYAERRSVPPLPERPPVDLPEGWKLEMVHTSGMLGFRYLGPEDASMYIGPDDIAPMRVVLAHAEQEAKRRGWL